MLSFSRTHLSFYLSFILYIACLVASAPTPTTYHRHQVDMPFPYGKLAEKMLNVNDISYTIDDREEDWLSAYPDYPTAFLDDDDDDLPVIPPTRPVLPIIIPKVETRSLSSFVYRLPHLINHAVAQEWNTALVLLRSMRKSQNLSERVVSLFSLL
jgi:hypothetical protein